ncbi:hypothetical protein SUZIE_145655 [Sciurus carolinensis]|uniref:Vexin n=1 Tax=Sciurus carolinensis TaxID=30640 RepID=A0AA41SZK8_SCICA|nr:hypothetical protein [Sciurus carolinensis]
MHQIYSCSDENTEVFTTVIPSGVSSPARRRVKSFQHLLTKNVVIESDLYTSRPLELLPHRSDRLDAGEGHRFRRLQNARPPGAHPAKTPSRPVEISEPKASNLCGNRAYGKSLIPPSGPDLSEISRCSRGGSHRLREWNCSRKRIQTSQEDDGRVSSSPPGCGGFPATDRQCFLRCPWHPPKNVDQAQEV